MKIQKDSFTPENNKEISFSNDLRVVGICNESEEKRHYPF